MPAKGRLLRRRLLVVAVGLLVESVGSYVEYHVVDRRQQRFSPAHQSQTYQAGGQQGPGSWLRYWFSNGELQMRK
jgi:hypothetical protein